MRVLDDLSAGDPARLHPDAVFTRGDVRDRPKLWTLLQKVDCVFHLAARVSVQESVLYPREYNDVNVGGTVSLAEAIRDAGVKRVVLASSATVYGPQPRQPVSETAWPHPQVPVRGQQARRRALHFCPGRAERHRDGRAAHLQRLRSRPAHPAGPCAGGAALCQERADRRIDRGPRRRQPDPRLRLHR